MLCYYVMLCYVMLCMYVYVYTYIYIYAEFLAINDRTVDKKRECFPCSQHQIDMTVFYPNYLRQKKSWTRFKQVVMYRLPFAKKCPSHVSFKHTFQTDIEFSIFKSPWYHNCKDEHTWAAIVMWTYNGCQGPWHPSHDPVVCPLFCG